MKLHVREKVQVSPGKDLTVDAGESGDNRRLGMWGNRGMSGNRGNDSNSGDEGDSGHGGEGRRHAVTALTGAFTGNLTLSFQSLHSERKLDLARKNKLIINVRDIIQAKKSYMKTRKNNLCKVTEHVVILNFLV